jgi:hypothetical protein
MKHGHGNDGPATPERSRIGAWTCSITVMGGKTAMAGIIMTVARTRRWWRFRGASQSGRQDQFVGK